jgi:Ankyrin repeats (3 copies)/Ankyrin repeat
LLVIFCKNNYCNSLSAVNSRKFIQQKQQDAQTHQASAREAINQSDLRTFDSVVDFDKAVQNAQKDLNPHETEITPESTDKKVILSNYPTTLISVATIFGITGLVILARHLHATLFAPGASKNNDPEEAGAIDDQNSNSQGKGKTFFLPMAQCGAFVGTMMDKTTDIFFYLPAKLIAQIGNKRGLLLIQAIRNGDSINEIEGFIQRGANINVQDDNGFTALHWATFTEKIDIVSLLLRYNADTNVKSKKGITPLHHAVWNKLTDIINVLLDYSADTRVDTNVKDKHGNTPFHYAIKQCDNKIDVVSPLLGKGADISIRDGDNKTPLEMATGLNYQAVIKLLSETRV